MVVGFSFDDHKRAFVKNEGAHNKVVARIKKRYIGKDRG